MGLYARDEIIGVIDGQKFYCLDCATAGLVEIEENRIISWNEEAQSDYLYFCDECEREI